MLESVLPVFSSKDSLVEGRDSLVAQMVKDPPEMRGTGFNPWIGKIPWRKTWQPTPVFLPGECHGQRSLAGYGPWYGKEGDTTEAT